MMLIVLIGISTSFKKVPDGIVSRQGKWIYGPNRIRSFLEPNVRFADVLRSVKPR